MVPHFGRSQKQARRLLVTWRIPENRQRRPTVHFGKPKSRRRQPLPGFGKAKTHRRRLPFSFGIPPTRRRPPPANFGNPKKRRRRPPLLFGFRKTGGKHKKWPIRAFGEAQKGKRGASSSMSMTGQGVGDKIFLPPHPPSGGWRSVGMAFLGACAGSLRACLNSGRILL